MVWVTLMDGSSTPGCLVRHRAASEPSGSAGELVCGHLRRLLLSSPVKWDGMETAQSLETPVLEGGQTQSTEGKQCPGFGWNS